MTEHETHRRDREEMLAERAAVAERRRAEAERVAADAVRRRREHEERVMEHFWADIAAERERDRALGRESIAPVPPERFLRD